MNAGDILIFLGFQIVVKYRLSFKILANSGRDLLWFVQWNENAILTHSIVLVSNDVFSPLPLIYVTSLDDFLQAIPSSLIESLGLIAITFKSNSNNI